ncbi:response regulator [Lacrimispora indolis]|uniref:response regulator n=1 Tax=Lacrimispora indolis TaxID=69825 RepID=UPI00045E85AB|nr:response regulator [Lacrimispora indolis]MBE7721858.1 response regulator [Lacrimispora celerecrescens]
MRAILVDDEEMLLREMERLLASYPDLEIAGSYTDPMEALREIESTRPELAFLDIEMRTLSGLELAERLLQRNPDLNVLFVTAYNQYAVEAFEINAIDYILKPVRPERLEKTMERIRRKRGIPQPPETLRIQFFGKFSIYLGKEAVKWNRSKPRELLAYFLANEGIWLDKFKICDDLWPENSPNQALRNLQTAVWAIRKCLREYGISAASIAYANDSYIFNLKDSQWDVRRYDEAFRLFMATGSSAAGCEAAALYTEDYLAYEDWNWAREKRAGYAIKQQRLQERLSAAGRSTAV